MSGQGPNSVSSHGSSCSFLGLTAAGKKNSRKTYEKKVLNIEESMKTREIGKTIENPIHNLKEINEIQWTYNITQDNEEKWEDPNDPSLKCC